MSSGYSKIRTKGGISISDINIGDIHYEFEYGIGTKCKVISKPRRNKEGKWTWQAENLKNGSVIDYLVTEGFEHYGPNLYDYEAYSGVEYI